MAVHSGARHCEERSVRQSHPAPSEREIASLWTYHCAALWANPLPVTLGGA